MATGTLTDIPAIITGTNADLIEAVAKLGYVSSDDVVFDATFGRGVWWKSFSPSVLIRGAGDFRKLPAADNTYDVVAFDPPYRLNGTPDRGEEDSRYGIDIPTRWQDRLVLMTEGLNECIRVTRVGGRVLMKCQDQVCSGKVRWQTDDFTFHAMVRGCEKLDELHLMRPVRPQPSGRDQVHARRNYSTLLVFRKISPNLRVVPR